jgi:hypothetical protein
MGQVLKGTVNTSTTEIRILEGRLHRNMTDDFSVTNLAEVRKGNMRIMFHAFNSNRKKAPKRKRGKLPETIRSISPRKCICIQIVKYLSHTTTD